MIYLHVAHDIFCKECKKFATYYACKATAWGPLFRFLLVKMLFEQKKTQSFEAWRGGVWDIVGNLIFRFSRACATVVNIISRNDLKFVIFSRLYICDKWHFSCMSYKKNICVHLFLRNSYVFWASKYESEIRCAPSGQSSSRISGNRCRKTTLTGSPFFPNTWYTSKVNLLFKLLLKFSKLLKYTSQIFIIILSSTIRRFLFI